MDKETLRRLIERYEDVYIFANQSVTQLIAECALDCLTIEQYALIRHLYRHGATRASELADIFEVNRSAITAKIDRLVAKDYVERQPVSNDRRGSLVALTKKGRESYEIGEEQITKFAESILVQLEPEEIESFINIYEKITKIIQAKA